jgi:O-antigen ligase
MIEKLKDKVIEYSGKGGLTFFSCLLALAILPVKVDFLPPVMILWTICWIVENRQHFSKIWNPADPAVHLFIGFGLYFLWFVAGLFYTKDMHNGTLLVFRRLSFVIFPLVLVFPGEMIRRRIKLLLKIFSISTLSYILCAFILALIRSLYFKEGSITFNPHPPEFDYNNYFFGTDFSFSQHPSYLAIYVMFSIIISIESFLDLKIRRSFRILWLFSAIVLLVSLYFLSSRAGILSAFILIPLYLIIQFKRKNKWWASLIIASIVVLVLAFSFLNNDRLKYYLPVESGTTVIDKIMLDNRVPIWKSTLRVIKHNLLLGVGAGDASYVLKNEYARDGYSEMYYNNLNAHNQYLEVLLGMGLIGFIIFISMLALMIYNAISRKNLIYGFFIMIILIFFLFESILNRIAGITFFSIFAFLLINLTEEKNLEGADLSKGKMKLE